MAFSDDALAQRLQNLATDRHLSGDAVGAKWLYEASARLMELSVIACAFKSDNTATEFEDYAQTIVYRKGDQQ